MSEKITERSEETTESGVEEEKSEGKTVEEMEGEVKIETTSMKSQAIQELLLDGRYDRYRIIPLAARWAQELKNKEGYKFLSFQQLLNTAVEEIVTGKVSIEEVSKLPSMDSRKMALKPQEKQAEKAAPAKKPQEKHEKTKPGKKEK